MPQNKKGGARRSQAKHQTSWHKYVLEGVSLAGDVLLRLVDRFGWPGAVFILGYLFVERHGTTAQKQEIIDRFILGKGISDLYQVIVLGVLFLIVVFAQRYYYKKRERILQREIDRLAEWKSAHQEANIAADLHHTQISSERG